MLATLVAVPFFYVLFVRNAGIVNTHTPMPQARALFAMANGAHISDVGQEMLLAVVGLLALISTGLDPIPAAIGLTLSPAISSALLIGAIASWFVVRHFRLEAEEKTGRKNMLLAGMAAIGLWRRRCGGAQQ